MNRAERARVAQHTMAILDSGAYVAPGGQPVSIAAALGEAISGTALYLSDQYDSLVAALESSSGAPPTIGVSNRTTLDAARDLIVRFPTLACLNFASAKHPGGGFLGGSQAQEESLARSSGLYAALREQPAFYEFHRRAATTLYSNRVIFSPGVPVFRDDHGRLLDDPWCVAFLTAAAVNAGAVRRNEPHNTALIVPTMEQRTRMILAVAAHRGSEALVLGAWGCGVFRNDPAAIAAIFERVLAEPPFRDRFRHIEFAVYDATPDQRVLGAFEQRFNRRSSSQGAASA